MGQNSANAATLRVGVAHHFGWAVVVTAAGDGTVADRRRIELIETGVPSAPIHTDGKELDDGALAIMVEEVRDSAMRTTAEALDDLAAFVRTPIVSMSLRAWPQDFPDDIPTLRQVQYEAKADSVMYREVLAECARARGWDVHLFDAKDVESRAAAILGARADDVLYGPRERLGAPWAKDHRIALAATILAGS